MKTDTDLPLMQAADYVGIDYRTLLRYVRKGKIQPFIQDDQKTFSYRDLQRLMEERAQYEQQQESLMGKKTSVMGIHRVARLLGITRMAVYRYIQGQHTQYSIPATKTSYGYLVQLKDVLTLKKRLQQAKNKK